MALHKPRITSKLIRDWGVQVTLFFCFFYLPVLEKVFICTWVPNFKSVALLILEVCLRQCQIL